MYLSEEFGPLYQFDGTHHPLYEDIYEEEFCKSIAEYLRVIYVGFTRAEKELYVVGDADFTKDDVDNNPLTSFFLRCCNMLSEEEKEKLTAGVRVELHDAPVSFERIIPVVRSEIFKVEKKGRENSIKAKADFIKEIEPLYNKASKIEFYQAPVKAFKPSSLEADNSDYSKPAASDPYPQIKAAVESTVKFVNVTDDDGNVKKVPVYDFGYNDFGTLAHLYMENLVLYQRQNALDKFNSFNAPFSYTAALSEEHKNAAEGVCKKMAENFTKSNLWPLIANAKFAKPELDFMANVSGYKVNGSIDLLFEDANGVFHIVDYKTDYATAGNGGDGPGTARADSDFNIEKYFLQLACYRKVAVSLIAQLAGKNVNEEDILCSLYYLRYDKEIDMDKKCFESIKREISRFI